MEPTIPLAKVDALIDGTLADPQLNHPEGVAVAADGAVWCGGERGELYRIAPDGTSFEQVASTGGFVLGVAFDRAGLLYACDLKHAAVFRYNPATHGLETFATGSADRAIKIPNWPVVDHERGCLYVSDSHGADEPGPGVWRFDLSSGDGDLWYAEDLVFANGMALSPDRNALYVAETFARRVSVIPIEADGSAGRARIVVDDIDRLPDGLAFDDEGRLYIACYEPSRIYRWDGGNLELFVDDPEAHTLCHPTNVAFRGSELFTSNLGRWHITRIPTDAQGLGLL